MEKLAELLIDLWAQTGSSVLTKVLIILCLLTISLVAISKIVDGIAKLIQLLIDGVKAAFTRRAGGRQRAAWLNRKRQFLSVLASDLGAIGKAEAWNDQHFTDLEAEVEIEGRYYASSLQRLLRKKSSGRRKEPSLITAIDSSSEKCLILVGDPGAGKSVALRHLALKLIERSKKTAVETAPVPLYINLRELAAVSNDPINANTIKEFVIDNVRRGDVETAEYIKENWRDFKERGIWFFLFDSFDEIPEVMHSAAGDRAVMEYSAAIRSFMDGFGACRSVLASREYKSPTSLVWPKLRILPLSESLQERLVKRTFLTDDQKDKVLLYISRSVSATYKNPLFLTLLCKYVKIHNSTPIDEHELLFNHVKSLTRRDIGYVERTWSFSPDELWQGACDLAKLLATSKLSLAPTVAEIIDAAPSAGLALDLGRIEPLIEALTYVKIGRTDVASSDNTVRRFAFSHRRYQESLFASYLSDHPQEISYQDLITDTRWREYLVALLQVAEATYVDSIVNFAATYLDRHILALRPTINRHYGIPIRSYGWDFLLKHILSLFLEAKLYFPEGPWHILEGPVEKLFGGAWGKGDYFDRLQVLRFCGIGSSELLIRRAESAVGTGISLLQDAALAACRFVVAPRSNLASWVRRQVGARMVASSRKFEVLRWEALAAELPEQFAIAAVIARAKALYRFSSAIRFVLRVQKFIDELVGPRAAVKDQSAGQMLSSGRGRVFISFWLGYLLTLVVGAEVMVARKGVGPALAQWVSFLVLSIFSIVLVTTLIRLACLSEPSRLSPKRVVNLAWHALWSVLTKWKTVAVVFAVSMVTFGLPGLVVYAVCSWLGVLQEKGLELVLLGSLGFYGAAFVVGMSISLFLDHRARKAAGHLLAVGKSFNAAVASAMSSREFVAICQSVDGSNPKMLRSAISLTSVFMKLTSKEAPDHAPPWLSRASRADIRHALAALLVKADGRKDAAE
jgi:hypothetical protein